MTVSDPVFYPARPGSAEAVRQDIWRTRLDLDEALGELLSRFDVKVVARRRLRALGRGVSRNPTVASGALVGAVLAAWLAAVPAVRRHWRLAVVGALGLLSGTGVAMGRRPVIVPVTGTMSEASDPLERYPSPPGGDVVDVLLAQHRRIEASVSRVRSTSGRAKFDSFVAFVELLNRHEHTEQEIVHPLLERLDSAQPVAADRLAEETAAERMLAHLISMGVDDAGFDRQFEMFAEAVSKHASAEETEEFPLLRAKVPADRLQHMANRVRAAQLEQW